MGTYALLGEAGWMLRENSKFTKGQMLGLANCGESVNFVGCSDLK